jgi:hypothetical protein
MKNSQITPKQFDALVKRAVIQQKRNRLFGQVFLMLSGYGLMFSALFCMTLPAYNYMIYDLAILSLFGCLVGTFGTLFYINDILF